MRGKYIFVLIALVGGCDSSPMNIDGGATTTVTYALPTESYVKLWVENSYNTVMVTLVDTVQAAGYWSMQVPASGWSSGVYFMLLEATPVSGGGRLQQERHMLLIR